MTHIITHWILQNTYIYLYKLIKSHIYQTSPDLTEYGTRQTLCLHLLNKAFPNPMISSGQCSLASYVSPTFYQKYTVEPNKLPEASLSSNRLKRSFLICKLLIFSSFSNHFVSKGK